MEIKEGKEFACYCDGDSYDYCSLERDVHECSIAEELDEAGLKKEDCASWRMIKSNA